MTDDPWDDWETAADANLDPKPRKIVDEHKTNLKLWQEANTFTHPEIIRTDSTRTEYVPELHILKRPTKPGSTTTTNPAHLLSLVDSSIPDFSKKSLQERETEYLLARQRIFGSIDNSDGGGGGSSTTGDHVNIINSNDNNHGIINAGGGNDVNDDKIDIKQIKIKKKEKDIHYEKPKINLNIKKNQSSSQSNIISREPKPPPANGQNIGFCKGFKDANYGNK
ncbi:23934_t:CDS:2 [Entrophospora sp. SA101]|nr:23934_t:CDS:2 [Entrophospora sp. SA101]CAJ0846377.1 14234_t:CDS:2 [Entrophospora sp. SA101]CAJ0884760.1 595_t:CDS:2 [Entrophospora sp. SA101]